MRKRLTTVDDLDIAQLCDIVLDDLAIESLDSLWSTTQAFGAAIRMEAFTSDGDIAPTYQRFIAFVMNHSQVHGDPDSLIRVFLNQAARTMLLRLSLQ